MSRWFRCGLAAAMLLIWLAPAQVWAYSYGDANTEDIAETFKAVVAAVGGNSLDWKAADEAYKVRRSEIKSHFGDTVSNTLDKNIEAKDNELLIANFKAVLVMNLDRRFTYALQGIDDYAATKLLLAKAKATFDTLAPYMSSGTGDINQAFEDALKALGNPGLFGVGKKESDPELFKQKVNFIYDQVKPLFPYKAYSAPAASAPATNPAKNQSGAEPAPGKEPAVVETPAPDREPTVSTEPSPSAEPPVVGADASIDSETGEEAAPTPADSPTPSVTPAETSEAVETNASADTADDSTQAAQGAEHAPMERTSKTNPLVTVFVIAGVIIVGGAALWFIRKKGFI